MDPEILHVGKKRVAEFLAAEPGLAIYQFPLEQTLRRAPHTLDDASEALIAKFALMDGAGGRRLHDPDQRGHFRGQSCASPAATK